MTVTAFEGLSPSKQAELFVDINAKQKSVKRSLLQELYAELHWDSEAPEVKVSWSIFESILANGKSGNKDKKTSWLNHLNEKRKIVSHASAGMSITLEELNELEMYEEWLMKQLDGYSSNDEED